MGAVSWWELMVGKEGYRRTIAPMFSTGNVIYCAVACMCGSCCVHKRRATTMTDNATEPTRRLSVEIPDSLHHQLRLLALQERTTLAAIVRELLEREIAARKPRDAA